MSLPPFEEISNFRDIGESINRFTQGTLLQPGLFFRSARPDEASPKDRERLTGQYGIKTIIDLRTTTEHINAAKKRSEAMALAQSAAVPGSDQLATKLVKIPGVEYAEINLNGKGFERSLIWKLSYFSLAKVIMNMALGYRMDAISIIAREVLQPRGLIGLGIDTIEHSGPEIKAVFDVLADENSWPVLIHCTQGKDRTGIIVVLVLLLCGIDIDLITKDYVQSELELESEIEERRKETSSIGLDESFSKCPKEFPKMIEQHIIEKYDSLKGYLNGLGIDLEQQQRIKLLLKANV